MSIIQHADSGCNAGDALMQTMRLEGPTDRKLDCVAHSLSVLEVTAALD